MCPARERGLFPGVKGGEAEAGLHSAQRRSCLITSAGQIPWSRVGLLALPAGILNLFTLTALPSAEAAGIGAPAHLTAAAAPQPVLCRADQRAL